MMKRKARKEQFVPYSNNGTSCYISYDFNPVLNKNGVDTGLGEWYVSVFKKIPTMDMIKKEILAHYNKKIDDRILSGLTWRGYSIWLSTENQFNYKAAYDVAVQTNGKNLPIVFKFGNNDESIYYEFKDMETITDFYFSFLEYIQKTLKEGWEEKDSIDWSLYQETENMD